MKISHESGTRKKAVARATLRAGTGRVRINNMLLDFIEPRLSRLKIQEALQIAGEAAKNVDIDVNVFGGGTNGQAEASRVAICRTLVDFDKKLQKVFMEYDRQLLVADVRQKEPRKPNTAGNARSKVQKSYR